MRIKHVIGVAALGAVALAACGGTSYSSASSEASVGQAGHEHQLC